MNYDATPLLNLHLNYRVWRNKATSHWLMTQSVLCDWRKKTTSRFFCSQACQRTFGRPQWQLLSNRLQRWKDNLRRVNDKLATVQVNGWRGTRPSPVLLFSCLVGGGGVISQLGPPIAQRLFCGSKPFAEVAVLVFIGGRGVGPLRLVHSGSQSAGSRPKQGSKMGPRRGDPNLSCIFPTLPLLVCDCL